MARSIVGASLAVLSVVALLVLHAALFAPMIASPSCPTTPLDPRAVSLGVALPISGVGVITAGMQLRLRVTATAAVVASAAAFICLVYAFLLLALFFCAVPAAY